MLEYWLWLTGRRGVGLRGLRALLEQFGTPEAVYCAAEQDYPQALRPEGRASLADKELAPARQILQQCYRKNIHVLTFQDAAYPNRLKNLDDAPLVLYYQGVFPDFDAEPVIAMVGTRKASAYGLLQAKRLGYELGRYGAIIVSGGAAGIDTMALRGAISSGTAPVAVFACGVDIDYPANNRSLFEDLRAHGCVISELPPGTPPLAEHFPPRNRILSGLALGSVVVEAPRKSGALITANTALEQGRDVFAVPGPIDAPLSRGCNRLIADGAAGLITDSWDVLREYEAIYPHKILGERVELPRTLGYQAREEQARAKQAAAEEILSLPTLNLKTNDAGLTDDQIAILRTLKDGALQVDDLIEKTQIPTRRVLSALTMMELEGYVEQGSGKHFSLTVTLLEE